MKNKNVWLVIMLLCSFASGAISADRPFSEDPIAVVGHGVMLDANGKKIEITKEFMLHAQAYYLSELQKLSGKASVQAVSSYVKSLERIPEASGVDQVQKDALLINWLLQRVPERHTTSIQSKIKTLNTRYMIDVLQIDSEKVELEYKTGLPMSLSKYKSDPINLFSRMVTNASGQDYVDECRKAGVPIPPRFNGGNWDSGDWTHNGDLDPDFLSLSPTADVYYHQSDSPEGTCIALPRRDGNSVSALGVICLSQETANACFWDRGATTFNQALTVSDFVGGVDLSNGTCSDCHAGENPFIVHPESGLNIGVAALSSPAWHDPLMKPSWPQNPGPLTVLDLVPLDADERSCLDCHYNLYAGRFPQVGDLPGYCSAVLTPAMALTMPPRPGGMSDSEFSTYRASYTKHMQALEAFCKQPPPDGTTVPVDKPDEDREFISAPVIVEPLYACAEAIEVTSVIYNAQLEVYIDGALVNTVVVKEPSRQIVKVPPLEEGQEVFAIQIKNGLVSDKSEIAVVSSHKEDYPDGLPRPEIDPQLIHQCGRVIAVRHVRGATVTVKVNGSDPRTVSTGGDWTNIAPRIRPFNLGDEYTAEQQICEDISPASVPQEAVLPPSPMPVPALINGPVIERQELIGIEKLVYGVQTIMLVVPAG
ncbi:MAG: hypothetical protein AB8B63_16260 [Granulosicoccus sp.]